MELQTAKPRNLTEKLAEPAKPIVDLRLVDSNTR